MYKRAFACRCPRCRTRSTLRMKPARYVREHHAKCRRCRVLLSIDSYRSSGREAKRFTCHCMHYPWPHRRGSVFCEHGAAGRVGLSFYDARSQHFYDWREGHERGLERQRAAA